MWISHKPKSVHTAEDELPNHHDEQGLVWEAEDGSVWETQMSSQWTGRHSVRGITWVICNPDRAMILKEKHGVAP